MFVMRHGLLTLLFLLSGCGANIEEEFMPYVRGWQVDIGVDTSELSIEFGDTNNFAAAQCEHISTTIVVNKEMWNRRNTLWREQVLYHEMGHCLLLYEHDERMVIDTDTGRLIPLSIMHPIAFGDSPWYTKYRAEYKAALKTKRGVF